MFDRNMPSMSQHTTRNPQAAVLNGFVPDLLRHLMARLQLQHHLQLVPDNKYGKWEQIGSWSGMIKEVSENVCMRQVNT